MTDKPRTSHAATGDLSIALQHTAVLLQNDAAAAAEQAWEILRAYPGERNARLLLAAAERRCGQIARAIDTLTALVAEDPGFAPAQEELGLCLLAERRWAEADAALSRAVELDDKLAGAWKALGDIRAELGDGNASQEAYRQHLRLSVPDPKLAEAGDALYAGKLGVAETLCREYLREHPTDVSAIRMLADVGIRIGRLDDAEKLLARCLELAPEFHLARHNLANLLFKKFRYRDALAELEKVIAAEPNRPSHLLLKASILARIGETDEAIDIYELVLGQYPRQSRTHLSKGHALKTVGRQADAVDAYRRSIELQPGLGEAYWSLANLKTFEFGDDEIEGMQRALEYGPASIDDAFHLSFALGKALEDRKEFDASFQHYQAGNAARRRTVRWDADDHARNLAMHTEFFDEALFQRRGTTGNSSAAPIFIVGLPRAGSTLLEQILASHSRVEGTMELPDIISIGRRLSKKESREDESQYPRILGGFGERELEALGGEYLRRTAIHRTGAPHFIDKMPNNFAHIGLIHMILPNAKIIDARRHPLACCFSGFKQLFASGQNFSYSLEEIGRYYRDYVEFMAHWDRVLPGRVLKVNYEDVVADTEGQVRRLLDYCGLEFEPACLEFYRTDRAVRTASSEQVRQPIYKGAVEQWRNYEAHLDPLKQALGPAMSE